MKIIAVEEAFNEPEQSISYIITIRATEKEAENVRLGNCTVLNKITLRSE